MTTGALGATECVADDGYVTGVSFGLLKEGNPTGVKETTIISAQAVDVSFHVCDAEKVVCGVGATVETLAVRNGTWRSNNHTLNVRRCRIEELCVGGSYDHMCTGNNTGLFCELWCVMRAVCSSAISRRVVASFALTISPVYSTSVPKVSCEVEATYVRVAVNPARRRARRC